MTTPLLMVSQLFTLNALCNLSNNWCVATKRAGKPKGVFWMVLTHFALMYSFFYMLPWGQISFESFPFLICSFIISS